jgi:AmmeMemoRadiSam system protein B
VAIALEWPAAEELPRLARLSFRPGEPLQATLFNLVESAANALLAQRVRTSSLRDLKVHVTVLYDPAMHGTVSDVDFAGFDPRQRALLVMENAKTAWVFDPQRSPAELLESASRAARVASPAAASVLSLAALSTEASVTVSNVPRPQVGPNVRPPAVAGSFYPADAGELSRLLDDLLADGHSLPESWDAALLPHAGLRYSGRIAAAVLQRIKIPDTVIVIGPKHTRLGVEWAVAPHDRWSLPGGSVESDPELARQLADTIGGLQLDSLAHQQEHGIEVELPLLARLAPHARVVGIALGGGDLERCRDFASGLTDFVRRQPKRPLLIISSDMNHFATDQENRRLDEMALQALERLDPADLYQTVTAHNISMCGVLPAVIVLETLRQLETLEKADRVAYATTADVTGDKSRVVGYAGMLFR